MIKAINVQTEERLDLAQRGEGNWLDWMAEQGYLICDRISLGHVCLELYQRDEDGVYALYHPPLLDLSVECLFFNIPDEAGFQELIFLTKKMLFLISFPAGYPSSQQ
ncbi:hypothetical protein ACQ4N7_23265 [Nodosilinea sp. AN01ver1]|uniref:hypothetical protein n=1 Tax=Nodosilinea sp. AN01ver1 TaxID=3423362 RepID=UPI003D319A17